MRLKDILEANDKSLTPSQLKDMEVARDFYYGQGRKWVVQHLEKLQLGITNDPYPIETQLLEYVVDSLAVVYRSPPTRWLTDGEGTRLPEKAGEFILFERAYALSQVDTVLREVDRLRSLYRQCVVRITPSDNRGRVVLQPASPLSVFRAPDPLDPHNIGSDRAVAVLLEGGEKYEKWVRDPEGWMRSVVDERDNELEPPARSPYGETLPMVVVYDGLPMGAWLPPRGFRTAYLLKLAALANQLVVAIKWNPTGELHFLQEPTGNETVKPGTMPTTTGPNARHVLPKSIRDIKQIQTNPLLEQYLKVIDAIKQDWLHAESLPTDSFRQSQTVTAIGLRTLAQPLQERQESLREPALEFERQLWTAFRAVHNAHADEWDAEDLPENLEIEVELGPLDIPADPKAHVETLNLRLLGKTISPIRYLQRLENVGRQAAIKLYKQDQEDWEEYPLEVAPRPGDTPPVRDEAPNAGASVTQAAEAATQTPQEETESAE